MRSLYRISFRSNFEKQIFWRPEVPYRDLSKIDIFIIFLRKWRDLNKRISEKLSTFNKLSFYNVSKVRKNFWFFDHPVYDRTLIFRQEKAILQRHRALIKFYRKHPWLRSPNLLSVSKLSSASAHDKLLIPIPTKWYSCYYILNREKVLGEGIRVKDRYYGL